MQHQRMLRITQSREKRLAKRAYKKWKRRAAQEAAQKAAVAAAILQMPRVHLTHHKELTTVYPQTQPLPPLPQPLP